MDRLLALSQKLLEAERLSEREPIYVALDLNEVQMITRMIGDYFAEIDTYAGSGHAEESY
jgi:hypothetical protein